MLDTQECSSPSPSKLEVPESPNRPERLQSLLSHFPLFPSPPTALSPKQAKWGHGERKLTEVGGWREEVTSPQLAPLPRSLKGRRKLQGLPPQPSPPQPAPGIPYPHPTQPRAQARSSLIHPNNNTSVKFQSLLLRFPKGLPNLSFPICKAGYNRCSWWLKFISALRSLRQEGCQESNQRPV